MHKILLVDDVKLLLEMQKKYLASSCVQILTAGNGLEALDVARRELPDLIVMDRYMPKMDGVTCCTAIKDDPKLKHIPVIIASNTDTPEDLDEFTRAGFSGFLTKPFDGEVFLKTLKEFLPAIERRASRIPFRAEVRLTIDGTIQSGMSEDVTLNGIYVATEALVSKGEEVALSFMLPGCDSPLEARGRVAWVNSGVSKGKNELNPGIGIEFLEITGQGIPFLRKAELNAFVARYPGFSIKGHESL
jgi:CheY-like chemotaxis protein